MTKLAPVMSALFPTAADAMKAAYHETSNASLWTKEVEKALLRNNALRMDDQVRRDIVQCIVTDYLINTLNDNAGFQRWGVEGGMH